MNSERLKYFLKFFVLAYLLNILLSMVGLNGPISMIATLAFCYFYPEIQDYLARVTENIRSWFY